MDNKYENIWEKLPFENFDQEELAKKIGDWKKYAAIVAEELAQGNNIGFISDTASGKTVIAILAAIGLGSRTIFLVPQRLLANQHLKLLQKISGGKISGRSITGEITKKENRIWNEISDRFIFATPHVFLSGLKKGRIDIGKFDLVIFDEIHRATGRYSYVPLAEEFSQVKTAILGLSASPGGNLEKIENLSKTLFLKKYIRAEIKTARKLIDLAEVELDDQLKKIDRLFSLMLTDVLREINEFGIEIDASAPLPMRKFEPIEKELISRDKYRGSYLAAKYRKLYHAYYNAMAEDYETFRKYLQKLRDESQLKISSRDIANDRRMDEILQLTIGKIHPKKEALIKLLHWLESFKKNALIFFYQKNTVEAAYDLASQSFRCEKIMGGKNKNPKHQNEVLKKLAGREIDFLFATSVAEEGLSIPEIDCVINYSMPPTEISMLQRNGRSGRIRTGNVVYLALNHPMDKMIFYASSAKVKKMRKSLKQLTQETPPMPAITAQTKKGRSRKKRDELTLSLF